MKYDAYNYPRKLEKTLENLEKNKNISERNKEIIIQYKKDCFARGLTLARIVRCIFILLYFATVLKKSFDEADINDIKNCLEELEKSHYAETTKAEMKVTLKKFYSVLRGCEPKEYPPEVKWIKNTKSSGNHKLPEDMLTEDDVKKLINATDNQRDKTFVAVLYESGCRISELLGLRIKHASFDKYGAQLTVDGKTGMRRIRIITSSPYLTTWINEHPDKDNPEACLWLSKRKGNRALSYVRTKTILKQLKERAGVKRAVNPHNFRHSRATFLAKYLSDAQLKQYFGWVQSSKMASVYIHMSGRDVEDALLKLSGIDVEDKEKQESKFKPKTCVRCETVNETTNKFCKKCAMPLDNETMIELVEKDMERKQADEILDKLLKDDKFKEMFLSRIKEMISK